MTLSKGDVVTVIADKSFLKNKQGQVEEILNNAHDGKSIVVKFGNELSYLFDYPRQPPHLVHFSESELQRDDDWTFENKLKRLWGRNIAVWHVYRLSNPFDPTTECHHEGCEKKATKRVLVNAQGTVIEYDVCDDHKKWHGALCDSFPAKPRKK